MMLLLPAVMGLVLGHEGQFLVLQSRVALEDQVLDQVRAVLFLLVSRVDTASLGRAMVTRGCGGGDGLFLGGDWGWWFMVVVVVMMFVGMVVVVGGLFGFLEVGCWSGDGGRSE